ncbi:MAG: SDR family oxidoreductase [Candidatus Rokuibacteriota bacterium]
MDHALDGRVAVVTGATSGIGRAIALALAAGGASIWAVGRREEALATIAAAGGRQGGRVFTHRADLCRDHDVQKLAARISAECRTIDVLIHSAGIFSRGRVGEAPTADLDAQYRTNVRAAYALTAAMLGLLPEGRGHIVFINSSVGLRAAGALGGYAMTKHALKALADALRDELNPRGIRVTSLFVGRTATPMQAAIHAIEGRTYRPERLLQPEDIAAVVVHALTSPSTAEITDISIRPVQGPRAEPRNVRAS